MLVAENDQTESVSDVSRRETPNILLVSAATPDTFWSYKHVLSFISKKACFPPLGLLTVAAMLPREWNLKLVDLNVTRLTDVDIAWADYVFVSAMIVQAESARRAIARCNQKGKTVIAGANLTGGEQPVEVGAQRGTLGVEADPADVDVLVVVAEVGLRFLRGLRAVAGRLLDEVAEHQHLRRDADKEANVQRIRAHRPGAGPNPVSGRRCARASFARGEYPVR